MECRFRCQTLSKSGVEGEEIKCLGDVMGREAAPPGGRRSLGGLKGKSRASGLLPVYNGEIALLTLS